MSLVLDRSRPLIANGIGVTAFFCLMFSRVEQLLATAPTSSNALPFAAVITRRYSASGMDWSLLAAAGALTMIPGAVVIWSGAQGAFGPKMNEEKDPEYWYAKAEKDGNVAPQRKLANEKPQVKPSTTTRC